MSNLKIKELVSFLLILISINLFSQEIRATQEILNHGKVIRKAFAEEDIKTLEQTHHPDVVKTLAYDNIQKGRIEVIKGLKETLKNFKLEFVKNDVENIYINNDIAIEQTKFSIKGTSKKGNDTFTFNGRTMVTYIRSSKSPTGWVTIREIIQPETKKRTLNR